MKKAVLFDLDNTLYDYDSPHKKALKEVYRVLKKNINISAKKFGYLFKISREEIHKELAGTASSHNRVLYFQRLVEKTHRTLEPKIILKLYDVYWNTLLKNMKLGKSVLKTLKILKKKRIKIAIISDLTTNIQLRKIDRLGITDYVDVLVTSEEAGSEKPHSIMFLLALNKLGILPKEAVMVGDNSISDIQGAKSIGIDTILFKKGKSAKEFKEDYKKPNYLIKEIVEVLDILEKIG